MDSYDHFLKHKEALTKSLEKSILIALNKMTVEEIKQLDFFNFSPIGDENAKIT